MFLNIKSFYFYFLVLFLEILTKEAIFEMSHYKNLYQIRFITIYQFNLLFTKKAFLTVKKYFYFSKRIVWMKWI